MVELPTQVTDNQISDIIKSETLEAVAFTSNNLTCSANCEETMKEKLDDEEIRDVVLHVVTFQLLMQSFFV